MADDSALAVYGEDFDLNLRRDHAAGKIQSVLAHRIAEGDAGGAGHG
jgi:hypothetical protein